MGRMCPPPQSMGLNRDGDSYLSRYSSRESEDGPAISRFSSLRESRKGRDEARLSREEIKEEPYTSRYSSLREEKKDDPVTSLFSSLNKEEKKEEPYSPRYSREEMKADAYKSSISREVKKTHTPQATGEKRRKMKVT